ncbi:MAG: acetate--CoA ligase [Cryomorphaceae bacterium]|nr:acetate--CoA ligase [Cryomorphaceae bacterium]
MNFNITDFEGYLDTYKKSIQNPAAFWDEIASNYVWNSPWKNTLDFDMAEARFKWFDGGRLNITINAIDRHLADKGEKTALLFEPNDPNEAAVHITYNELFRRVNKMANVLKSLGIEKGDRVCIYLPMIPELAISVLACARIGAIHSVVFAGFSSSAVAARIQDAECNLVITSDGGFRGNKTVELKKIVDEALKTCPSVKQSLIFRRTGDPIKINEGFDIEASEMLQHAGDTFEPEPMDAEDPLFILYTSGSTGKPKGMVHTCGGYMVYTGYTFKNVFQYKENDIFWCTADIGWITGHSYLLYGALLNGATTVLFEGIPSYPDFGRFWEIIAKHKITHLYTAPTAIRSLAKESLDWIQPHDLSSLKILGSVGEPINEEAWHWYHTHIGQNRCPIVDTWWQTETGGILIAPLAGITSTKPAFATLPLPGVRTVLMDDHKQPIEGNGVSGNLCLSFPWPSIARTIWGDHQRYKETYFSTYPGYYFTGDGALRDETGNYRITGRVDDIVIVSGHNLGTAPIEDAINEHPSVAESALVGYPHDIKGNALFGFIILRELVNPEDEKRLFAEINKHISDHIGPIAKLDKMVFVSGLPKTRSGKIMRRILRKIAEGDFTNFGDTSTLLNPEVVDEITYAARSISE